MSVERLEQVRADLRALHEQLRSETLERYQRMNPFVEDLFDWKERGRAWTRDDRGVTIYNSTTLVGDVSIGEETWIGPFCALDGPGGLTIGRRCSISAACQLYTHDTARWSLSGGRAEYDYAPTRVGDCCFLGAGVIVTMGVTIGDHCLIGAGSVVTHDIMGNSIAAGVPAERIGKVEVDADGVVALNYF